MDSRNVCPTGWHVPTDIEWTTLTNYLGGESVAGEKLKETGTRHWKDPNIGSTNETGFSALPGGDRYSKGIYFDLGTVGIWWSASECTTPANAWYRYLEYNSVAVFRDYYNKNSGLSVRCLKD